MNSIIPDGIWFPRLYPLLQSIALGRWHRLLTKCLSSPSFSPLPFSSLRVQLLIASPEYLQESPSLRMPVARYGGLKLRTSIQESAGLVVISARIVPM